MNPKDSVYFKNKNEWRTWLQNHHDTYAEIWVLHYKKSSHKISMNHFEAVEEALCFGWIDSTLKKIDEDRFILKFTPRKPKSVWSKINKEKAEQLIREGKMTPAGFQKIEEAKKQGVWDTAYTNSIKDRLPTTLKNALRQNPEAWKNFQAFANSYRNMYIGWVKNAKTDTTRNQRINTVVNRSLKNLKPGETE